MKTIYFSSAITGTKAVSEDFQVKMVDHMKSLGFKVLSEHVGLQHDKEIFAKLTENSGKKIPQRDGFEREIRQVDLGWVDQADYFIGIVDGPSFGVGIEIQHAILRPARGLKESKILCLVHVENYPKLTAMIKGITEDNFQLKTYRDEENAMNLINKFLNR